MKKYLIFIAFLAMLVVGILSAQKTKIPIDTRWDNIAAFAEKQLPESAIKELDEIITQAKAENNSVQLIKALIYKMRFTLDINPDKAPDLIKEFELFTQNAQDPAEQALLYSMSAELFQKYYQNNQWNINRRTEVVGVVPSDIQEWTRNTYVDKISKLLDLSTKDAALLQKTEVLKFKDLIVQGADSRNLEPTLFDLLAYRKIEILSDLSQNNEEDTLDVEALFVDADRFITVPTDNKILQTYQQLLAFHIADKNTAALLFADLDRLKYLNDASSNNDLYRNALADLKTKYLKNELVVEVMAEQANSYLQMNFALSEVTPESKKAYEICEEGIQLFPNYKRIDVLKNIQKNIAQKLLNTRHNDVVKPNAELDLHINSANIKELNIKIYRIDATALEYDSYNQDVRKRSVDYPKRTLMQDIDLNIKTDENFKATDTTVVLQSGEYGIYEIQVAESANPSQKVKTVFVVSDFAYMARSNMANFQSLYVLDRISGIPQKDVQVKSFEPKWNGEGYSYKEIATVKTDKSGLCNLPFSNNYMETKVYFERGNDKFFTNLNYAYHASNVATDIDALRLSLLTDRSLYRPGQIVHFKGIAFYANKNKTKVQAGSVFKIELYDANNQLVSTKELKSNEFGSFAGEFVLPDNGLNGRFRIQSAYGSKTIWVEEYKRPTFEVKIDRPKTQLRFGDKAIVIGSVNAFAGFAVAGAKVNYRVTRQSHVWCWWWNEPETEIANGTLETDANGAFEISFVPEKSKSPSNSWRGDFYTYNISADVTDIKGETQQGEASLSVGDKALFINFDMPEKVEREEGLKLLVNCQTLNAELVDTKLDYEVYSLEDMTDYIENKASDFETKTIKKVLSGVFNSKNKVFKQDTKSLNPGQYKLVFKTKDAFGNEVKTENNFIVYKNNACRPPVKTYKWLQTSKLKCNVGEKAIVRFGTSSKNTKVLFEIMQGDKILYSKWLKFNNQIRTFKIPFKESYGAGVSAMFSFMKDEKLFTEKVDITRETISKQLKPHFTVFRDKLLPGENATWTVTVPESVNKLAELLVDMYDASLDAIRPHDWNFSPIYNDRVLIAPNWIAKGIDMSDGNVYIPVVSVDVPEYQMDVLNWFDLSLANGVYTNIMMRGSRSRQMLNVVEDDVVFSMADGRPADKQLMLEESVMPPPPAPEVVEQLNVIAENPVQIRTNFNETAFFYPQLQTDKEGNVQFSFTAPESLTRWNVKMLAHTKDLYFGQFDTTAVTQKDIMVQMNLPRFVRRSDKLVLSANVINLSNTPLTAKVQFELIDPATDKAIALKDGLARSVEINANASKIVEWEISEFSSKDLVICKVLAHAGNFSDGEQKYLAVLPDQVLVTESLALTIRGNQTRTFSFESLLKNASKVETQNLAVEFSSNPAWYAIQALPTLASPQNSNAIDYFTAYYVNSLAAYIANSNPKIAATFDRWKVAGDSREALLSNLQKNTELKNMLLEETPWVMAAKDETEQKKQIALLFDLNMQKNQAQQYLDKLMKLQTANGGFSWFENMPESRYITQEIMLNLARLKHMTGKVNFDQNNIKLALNYLDLEIAKDFDRLKKNNKNYQKQHCIDNEQLFYLHMRSEYREVPIASVAEEALNFYTAQSEKYWTSFTLYGKAMMAVVAHRNGKINVANEILKSLKENALKTDEFGMYWAKNTAGYFWSERPIAVQAAIIEAFNEVSKITADIEEMKIWLLKQKQTERWDSPSSTVDAIYALLLQGNDWLANEGKVDIKLGTKSIKPKSVEAGTAYFKQTVPAADVVAEMGKVTVTKLDKGMGWGAIYWQYYQNQDEVEAQSAALKITKKLFVEQQSTKGSTMLPIEQVKLKKGDKVITRLVVTTDRNLDFVALKDLRAACFEPVNQRSGCEWKENVCYYQTTKDASTQFFFSHLPKGTYVFEYEMWVNNSGIFTSGIASIQCEYAPEFVSHTGGEKIEIQ